MSNNNVNDKYQKMDPVEHVLKLPDTYVGSTEKHTEMIDVIVEETNSEGEIKTIIQKKRITFVPALYKIYDEILANAEDQDTRLKMDKIAFLKKKSKKKWKVNRYGLSTFMA